MVKILKIYKCKDGRVRARIKRDDGTKKVVSYPRILLEMKLGKPIDPKFDVHHIDGDYTNNSLDNLELVLHGVHQKKHAEKKKKYKDSWRIGDTLNLSIGQGFLNVTPLQIVRAVDAIANGGILVQPHLLKDTKTVSQNLNFDPKNLKIITLSSRRRPKNIPSTEKTYTIF